MPMPREKSCCTCTCTFFKPIRRRGAAGCLTTLIRRPLSSLCSLRLACCCGWRKVVAEHKRRRSPRQREYKSVRAVFWPLVSMHDVEESDKLGDLPSLSTATERSHEPFPSPATPAFIKMVRLRRSMSEDTDVQPEDPEVEAACRSFEGYLMAMLLEDHKMRDLKDVEELIGCWDSLKSPVFLDLVCRFYGELCKDLFSESESESESPAVDNKLH